MRAVGVGVCARPPAVRSLKGGDRVAYTTEDAVRSLLNVSSLVLSDEAAGVLIDDASDLIDEALGARPVDPDTGRKVVEADVETWQWVKLGKATAKLAAQIYRDPSVATGQRWRRQKAQTLRLRTRSGRGRACWVACRCRRC